MNASDILIQALLDFSDDEDVSSDALITIQSIMSANAAFIQNFECEEFVGAVVASLQKFPLRLAVRDFGCGIIELMCMKDVRMRTVYGNIGACTVLLDILNGRPYEIQTLDALGSTLGRLPNVHVSNRDLLIESGAMRILTRSIAGWKESDKQDLKVKSALEKLLQSITHIYAPEYESLTDDELRMHMRAISVILQRRRSNDGSTSRATTN